MRSIETLCEVFRRMNKADYATMLGTYTMKAAHSCMKYSEDDADAAMEALGTLACGALIADGKLSDGENDFLFTGLKVVMGAEFDLDDCRRVAAEIIDAQDSIKDAALIMAEDYLSLWNADDKEDVILFCIALCAVDGEISAAEQEWLEDLAYSAEA